MNHAPVISSFSGPYRFLSNFWLSFVVYGGCAYPTAEHAYQAAKTLDPEARKAFQTSITPGRAKALGRSLTLRPDWEQVKFDVMLTILRDKFHRHPCLASALLSTGGATLIEGNTWGDQIWGVCNGYGQNHLGRLLMQVRAELKATS